MQHVIIHLMLIATHLAISGGFSIDCEYYVDSYAFVGTMYACTGTIVLDDSKYTVTSTSGSHHRRMNDSMVEALFIYQKNLNYFPKNVERFFPNLKAISLDDNLITKVSNVFLRPHKNLEWLNLLGNRITKLDSDIFDGLPNLQIANFYRNNIKEIGQDIKLPGNINFHSNICIDMGATTPAEIATLQLTLLVKCSHNPRMLHIEQSLITINNNIQELKENL